jgi:hypothetical protein
VFGLDDSQATRATLGSSASDGSSCTTSTCASRSPRANCGGSPTGWPRRAGGRGQPRVPQQGLAYLSTDGAGITARLVADVRLLRLPLVRYGDDVTAGKAEATWKAWLARPR